MNQPETVKLMKPLRRKLQKCRDPDRADLMALQKARREQAGRKERKSDGADDGMGSAGDDAREAKRRKMEKKDDVFGPAL